MLLTAHDNSFGILGTSYLHLHTSIDAAVVKEAADDLINVSEKHGITNFPQLIETHVNDFIVQHQQDRLAYMNRDFDHISL